MRAMKKNAPGAAGQDVKISAADPLNLAGLVLPGPRVPAVPTNFIIFRDGQVVRTELGRDSRMQAPVQRLDVGRMLPRSP
jgi:ATP-dependent Lhr-like helicase